MRYAIVIEKAENNYLPMSRTCPATTATGGFREEVEAEIREAIEFHLDGMREDGVPIPVPQSRVEDVEVSA